MSLFQFFPFHEVATRESPFASCSDGFSREQVAEIRKFGDGVIEKEGLDGRTLDTSNNTSVSKAELRRSKIAAVPAKPETLWLYDRIRRIAQVINGEYFEFELWGIVEDLQYTVYGGDGSHYDWHMDKGAPGSPRKLSLVMQLSDPDEYEGGDLQLMFSASPITCQRKMGMIYAFPSWILHRVTPVTAGTRRSLVVWVAGTRFR